MKDFDSWNHHKKELEQVDIPFYYKNREIWFCSIGANVGYEQDGKNAQFERPVLVLRKFNKFVFWGIPLSTRLKPDNTHYMTLKHQKLEFSAIISQLRLYDSRRLTRKLYMLDKVQYEQVKYRLLQELQIKKSDPTCAESSEPEGHCGTIVPHLEPDVKHSNKKTIPKRGKQDV